MVKQFVELVAMGQQRYRARSVNIVSIRFNSTRIFAVFHNFSFLRSYFVVSSRSVRPGQIYRVAATVYTMKHPITVRAAIQWNGVEVASDSRDVKKGITEVLLMRVFT